MMCFQLLITALFYLGLVILWASHSIRTFTREIESFEQQLENLRSKGG